MCMRKEMRVRVCVEKRTENVNKSPENGYENIGKNDEYSATFAQMAF